MACCIFSARPGNKGRARPEGSLHWPSVSPSERETDGQEAASRQTVRQDGWTMRKYAGNVRRDAADLRARGPCILPGTAQGPWHGRADRGESCSAERRTVMGQRKRNTDAGVLVRQEDYFLKNDIRQSLANREARAQAPNTYFLSYPCRFPRKPRHSRAARRRDKSARPALGDNAGLA